MKGQTLRDWIVSGICVIAVIAAIVLVVALMR
jgi:hypothetical protein